MSSYYQERMDADLLHIRTKLQTVSDLVQEQLADAVRALFEVDRGIASTVVLGDRQVNRRIKQIDGLCHTFIVRHAPSEEYLRQASAVLRLDVALERIGDYASAISREVGHLEEGLPESVAPEVSSLADRASSALAEALVAFHERDEARARGGLDIPEAEIEAVFAELTGLAEREERSLTDVFRYRHVCNLLMRVAEQAKNIREQTLFALHGEVVERRAFRVLFVDERGDRLSHLAAAYASTHFPESGSYRCAGWSPSEAVDPSVVEFLASKGLQPVAAAPSKIEEATTDKGHHVIVVVGPGDEIGTVPFKTTLLRWDVTDEADPADLDALYDALSDRVEVLMHTLVGPEAA